MAKVITFSTKFPSYHPKAGQETNFAQKFWASISVPLPVSVHAEQLEGEVRKLIFNDFKPKHHTIRAGKRWKAGEMFSPRIWSGVPYQSKQLILADDVEIKNVWDFEIKKAYKLLPGDYDMDILINHRYYNTGDETILRLAINDGLSLAELLQWFKYPKEFSGQIICWNDKITY